MAPHRLAEHGQELTLLAIGDEDGTPQLGRIRDVASIQIGAPLAGLKDWTGAADARCHEMSPAGASFMCSGNPKTPRMLRTLVPSSEPQWVGRARGGRCGGPARVTLRRGSQLAPGRKVARPHVRSAELERVAKAQLFAGAGRHLRPKGIVMSDLVKTICDLTNQARRTAGFSTAHNTYAEFSRDVMERIRQGGAGAVDAVAADFARGGYTLTEADVTALRAAASTSSAPRAPSATAGSTTTAEHDMSALVTAGDAAILADAAVSAGVIDRTKRDDLAAQMTGRSRKKARGLIQALSQISKGK